MTELLEFVSGLLDGAALVALSVSLGGVACVLVILRPIRDQDSVVRVAGDALLRVSVLSLCALTGLRILQLALKAVVLSDGLGFLDLQAFMQTRFFRFGVAGILLTLCVAGSVANLRRDVSKRLPWVVVFLMAGLFMVNEAWLTHAASRLENQGPLMVATMVHVCGATVWAGGVVHMVLLWRMMRKEHAGRWSHMVARFSPLGIGCMGLIVGPGVFLWWHYVGSWAGLIGTGYGHMLLVKMALFACVLVLAAINFLATRQRINDQAHDPRSEPVLDSTPACARRDRGRGSGTGLWSRVPAYLEVEILLAGVLLFTAASLTGFPPSVDVDEEAVTVSEILKMYDPKIPHLRGPQRVLIDAPELINLKIGEMGKKEDVSWDRFNHNAAGVIILAMSIMALCERLGRFAWARLWPLTFLGLSGLIFVFANPDHWPLGSIGLTASLQNPEVVQHWVAAVVVFGLGWSEWLARTQPLSRKSFRLVFPFLCIVGGMIMLTHSHGLMERKQEFLIQSTHVAIGGLAVLMGCAGWLQIRLPAPHNRLAGLLSLLAMVLVGFVLLFYIQPDSLVI